MVYTDTDLATLKAMLEETDDSARVLTDARLALLLTEATTLRDAAYQGALLKAHNDGVRMPDGTSVDSNRSYWLTVAASYRRNRGGPIPRADDVPL